MKFPAWGALAMGWGLAGPAIAQDDEAQERIRREIERSSIERSRQSEAFGLQLEQRQRELLAPPESRPALETLHAEQRRRFENLSERQDSEMRMSSRSGPSWGPRLDTGPQQERERRAVLERARRESEARAR
jgi:hypothetical protein